MKADNFCPYCGKNVAVEAGISRKINAALGDFVEKRKRLAAWYYCPECNSVFYALFSFQTFYDKDGKGITN